MKWCISFICTQNSLANLQCDYTLTHYLNFWITSLWIFKMSCLKWVLSQPSVNFLNDMFEMGTQSTMKLCISLQRSLTNMVITHLSIPELLNNNFVNFENDMFQMGAQSTMKLCISFICSQHSLTNMVIITHLYIHYLNFLITLLWILKMTV